MTEKITECLGTFEVFGSYHMKEYDGRYVAVGGMSCPVEDCDFDGTIEGRSYSSAEEARDQLMSRIGVKPLTRCKLYREWRRDPANFGKDTPQEVLPEFLREETPQT